MPFEARAGTPRKIAVVGGGISGMGAAYMLAEDSNVTLFEAEPRLGGHARTIIAGRNGDQPVDTGFIVFNYANYPHLAKLFAELDVPVVKSNMSFAASLDNGRIEYALATMKSIFAQKRNLVNPKFLRMLRDITRFNKRALDAANDRTLDLGAFLDRLGTGPWFRDYYLSPLTGAIWSTPTEKVMEFPAHALVRFMENHALLSYSGQHQWYTVQGGSVEYVGRLEAALRRRGVSLRIGAPVDAVRRSSGFVEVKASGGDWEAFDEIIFATHSDDTLRLLSDASAQERAALGAIKYQPNRVVLHADDSVMPSRRICWSSWNYTEGPTKEINTIDLTYWMNSLQPIPQEDPHFVTLNSTRPIREELIYDECVLRHPVYDLPALEAQETVRAMNGAQRTWFCGAWMKNGFHEDGLGSAVDVVEAMHARDATAASAA
ncbi:FAD-dependent oxidoreductase [Marivita sp. GX14005]|uniref:NAD(P)/FAD-dependent oxidoreductase n=1 Tax=Marivita sp. GX14005 TaxID=2942276 RepID=UPI002018E9BE|nr:FAD-dependent oxidoreductase [Marivita sp. GX14005]MCL3881871.1 FAD-dependent oxidoreductase [Marivita sp. GX14005]